jgi:hypothetical protein
MPQPVILQGDAVHLPFADHTVHCCATSPPYWGLRSYEGLEPTAWIGGTYQPLPGWLPLTIPGPTSWEGLNACAHVWDEEQPQDSRHRYTPDNSGAKHTAVHRGAAVTSRGATCQQCQAWRGTLGNEPTPCEFIWHLILVMREVRRVLRDDGVTWINLGDSFSAAGKSGGGAQGEAWADHGQEHVGPRGGKWHTTPGYPAGALLGIPGLFHQAALGDGWVVRQECVWTKASCMPESVKGTRHAYARCACATPHSDVPVPERPAVGGDSRNGSNVGDRTWRNPPDPACPICHGTGRLDTLELRRGSWRHTRATESVFMLTKGMEYWSDGEAVREERSPGTHGGLVPNQHKRWTLDMASPQTTLGTFHAGRNPRNVLTPKPSSLNLAHYAAFPPGLVEPLIKATCPAQCCAVCGAGYAPVVTSQRLLDGHIPVTGAFARPDEPRRAPANGIGHPRYSTQRTVGHALPTCTCMTNLPPVPGKVLDCFAGASTTLLVARALCRQGLGIEASPTYTQLSRERLGFADLAAWEGTATAGGALESFLDLPLFAERGPTS